MPPSRRARQNKAQEFALPEGLGSITPYDEQEALALAGAKFDPETFVEEALTYNLDSDTFTQLDEREIPRARNIFEYTVGSQYMNAKPFPRQLQIMLHLYGDACFDCSDQELLNDMYDQEIGEIADRIQMMHFGKCPKCGKTRLDFYKSGQWPFYQSALLLCGQRSGKSKLTDMISNYHVHRMLTLERDGKRIIPYKYYNQLPTIFRLSFTAVSMGQAIENLWLTHTTLRDASPWYQTYHQFLKYHEKRLSTPLLTLNTLSAAYHNKKIALSAAVPDMRKLRGRTRFFSSMDELAFFDGKVKAAQAKVLGDASEVWTSMNNSLATLRNQAQRMFLAGDYDVLTAYSFDISSPSDVNDYMCTSIRKAQATQPQVFVGHWATWEFSPEYRRDSPFIQGEFAKNYDNALRDYGAIPPMADSPWCPDTSAIIDLVRTGKENPIVSYETKTEQNTKGDTLTWLKFSRSIDPYTPRLLTLDCGLVNNAFSAVLSSLDENGKLKIDQIFVVNPNGNKVNIDKMFTEFVEPLSRAMQIVLVGYDQWNSIQSIQALRDNGKDARQYSLKPVDFSRIKSEVYAGNYSFPPSECSLVSFTDRSIAADMVEMSLGRPNFALVLQALTVREIAGKVLKPKRGDDDIFRAFCLAAYFAADPKILQELRKAAKSKLANSGGSAVGVAGYFGASWMPQPGRLGYGGIGGHTGNKPSRIGVSGYSSPSLSQGIPARPRPGQHGAGGGLNRFGF